MLKLSAVFLLTLIMGLSNFASANSSYESPDLRSEIENLEGSPSRQVTSPVKGTFLDSRGKTGHFKGHFEYKKFINENNEIFVQGKLTGVMRDSKGNVIGNVSKYLVLPVDLNKSFEGINATCDILNLVLGPLDLNLLGLRVQLDTVRLDITAESGPGNLLGNLLCAVAGLLDFPNLTGVLTNILNAILGALRL